MAVFRPRSGRVYATQARCPHREGPLADGLLAAGVVVCPLHALKFDLESGAPLGNDCPALQTYVLSVSPNGELLLTVNPEAAA